MRARSLAEITSWLGGKLEAGGVDPSPSRATGASIDTRFLQQGDLFFALPGEHTHGIRFAKQACDAGAVAVVTDPEHASQVDGVAIVVADPRRALGQLAATVRAHEKDEVPAVAITGSVGKTTTCRYAAELLAGVVDVHRPPRSYNNDLGVPLTLLNAPQSSRLIIAEVGASAPGEIARLGAWVRPVGVCVTEVGAAHLEGFGSVEVVEREKLSLLESLEPSGTGWIPAHVAARHPHLLAERSAPVFTFGRGGNLEILPNGRPGRWTLHCRQQAEVLSFDWQPPFPHSVSNLEAALALCIGLGFDAADLLERIPQLTLPALRGEEREYEGVRFLLDCYNSNPMSLESAITRLEQEPQEGRRICVVGTMEELGDEEQDWHERMGQRLAESEVDEVFVFGRGREWYRNGLQAGGREGRLLADDLDSVQELASSLSPGDQVLFKASRKEALERFAARVADVLSERSAHVVR